MEISNERQIDDAALSLQRNSLQISCNWQISNNKQFHDAFTVLASSQEPEKTDFEDVVSLDRCISVQPIDCNKEACTLDIKITNGQKISKIAVVSEAYVLEFFKEFGEYETTVFAEFVDEFADNSVYFAETAIFPHTTEARIKFAKTNSKNSTTWIYGIRLYLTELNNESKNLPTEMFNPEIINNFLTKLSFSNENTNRAHDIGAYYRNFLNSFKCNNIQDTNVKEESDQSSSGENISCKIDIVNYIDKKFQDVEGKLMKRIDEMEQRTNQKLDAILKQLEHHSNIK